MASVAPLPPRVFKSSPDGIGEERVAVRVSTTVWQTSGSVSSHFKAAAAAVYAGTPGVTS
jgi:hypothetical protein